VIISSRYCTAFYFSRVDSVFKARKVTNLPFNWLIISVTSSYCCDVFNLSNYVLFIWHTFLQSKLPLKTIRNKKNIQYDIYSSSLYGKPLDDICISEYKLEFVGNKTQWVPGGGAAVVDMRLHRNRSSRWQSI